MKVVIFGGSDHEEQAARKIATKEGCLIATATVDGIKCHAGNTYKANGYTLDENSVSSANYFQAKEIGQPMFGMPTQAIIFECNVAAAGDLEVIAQCDHHNPGDYGYGLAPDRFWEASSIGQLCALLDVPATEYLLMVAAGDHCPTAAYKGLCPEIDVEKFKNFRIDGISTTVECPGFDPINAEPSAYGLYNNRDEVEKQIEFATKLIHLAPESQFGGVKDLRQYGKVDQLPEAALISGLSYMSQLPETDRDGNPTGNVKVTLGGDNSPETVSNVMAWLNSLPSGESPAYGVPARGFAGRVFTNVWMPS